MFAAVCRLARSNTAAFLDRLDIGALAEGEVSPSFDAGIAACDAVLRGFLGDPAAPAASVLEPLSSVGPAAYTRSETNEPLDATFSALISLALNLAKTQFVVYIQT